MSELLDGARGVVAHGDVIVRERRVNDVFTIFEVSIEIGNGDVESARQFLESKARDTLIVEKFECLRHDDVTRERLPCLRHDAPIEQCSLVLRLLLAIFDDLSEPPKIASPYQMEERSSYQLADRSAEPKGET